MQNDCTPCSISREYTSDEKMQIMINARPGERFNALTTNQYKNIRSLLDKIPNDLFIKFLEKNSLRMFYSDQSCNFDFYKNFKNWGETFEAVYQNILYPSDIPARPDQSKKTQIAYIQQFVKNGVKNGKRVRGSGIRHSWGKIFADINQLLVSFYPYNIAKGSSRELENWAIQMDEAERTLANDKIQHLNMIRKVGEYDLKGEKKHLIKIGAGVSNDQLRRWSIRNGYQYKSNAILVEINVCGGLGTCSHGSGKDTQTLADYVYEIQFIDYNGNRQILSKKDQNAQLIKSAASALGLLGLIIFVTMEFDQLEIVRLQPRKQYKDFVIPWPKDYPQNKINQRKEREEYKRWLKIEHQKQSKQHWDFNFKQFKKAINKTYNQFFYFPMEEIHCFENGWSSFAKKTPENISKIKEDNPNGVFLEVYPPQAIQMLGEFSLFVSNKQTNTLAQASTAILMRSPYLFMPNSNIYINYPDAVHLQRGIQNIKIRDFQVQIDIPGQKQPDYNLIQWLWWDALQIVEENKDLVNIALQMRIFKGSEATLAPQNGMDFVCSIQILRTLALNERQEGQWANIVHRVFNAWRSRIAGRKNSKGQPLAILPHWGKEWDFYPQVKEHVMKDESIKINFKQFLKDYKQIASIKNFDYQKNLSSFSNEIYRELVNEVIECPNEKIK